MDGLEGATAVVTGGSRGIGRAIAQRLAERGARVAVNFSSSRSAAEDVVRSIRDAGGEAEAFEADVSRPDEIGRMFDAVASRFGGIDVVVANAGVELVDLAIADVTEEQFDRAFAVNTKGAFFTLQHAARTISDGGRIIVIGSSSTEFPTSGHGLYGGSKIASRFLVEVLAKELGHRRVTVNSIHPTAVEGAGVGTEGLRPSVQRYIEQNNPMGRAGTPTDVADAVEFLAGPLSSYVSGQHLLLTGGATA